MNAFFQTLLDLVAGEEKITLEAVIAKLADFINELTKFVEGKID